MDFDATNLVPTPTNWLNTRVCYEGTARAEFENPPGTVEGPATVSFDSAGNCRVRIAIEKIEAQDEKNFNLGSGSAPAGTFFINGFSNPCRSLTVTTAEGVFTGGDRITHAGVPFGVQKSVDLRPLRSKFEVNGACCQVLGFTPVEFHPRGVERRALQGSRRAPSAPVQVADNSRRTAPERSNRSRSHARPTGRSVDLPAERGDRLHRTDAELRRAGEASPPGPDPEDNRGHGRPRPRPVSRLGRPGRAVPSRHSEHVVACDGNHRRGSVDRIPGRERLAGPKGTHLLRRGPLRTLASGPVQPAPLEWSRVRDRSGSRRRRSWAEVPAQGDQPRAGRHQAGDDREQVHQPVPRIRDPLPPPQVHQPGSFGQTGNGPAGDCKGAAQGNGWQDPGDAEGRN